MVNNDCEEQACRRDRGRYQINPQNLWSICIFGGDGARISIAPLLAACQDPKQGEMEVLYREYSVQMMESIGGIMILGHC